MLEQIEVIKTQKIRDGHSEGVISPALFPQETRKTFKKPLYSLGFFLLHFFQLFYKSSFTNLTVQPGLTRDSNPSCSITLGQVHISPGANLHLPADQPPLGSTSQSPLMPELGKKSLHENCWGVRTSGTCGCRGWTVTNLSRGTQDICTA